MNLGLPEIRMVGLPGYDKHAAYSHTTQTWKVITTNSMSSHGLFK